MSKSPDPHEHVASSYRDDPDMAELVRMFVGEMPARVEALERAWNDRELVKLTRLTHQLKGCCAGYGFATIGRAAAALEGRLRELDATAAEDRLRALASEFDELVELCSRAARV